VRNVRNYLKSFGKKVVSQAKNTLKQSDKNVSGTLLKSINYEVKENAGEYVIEFKMSDYGQFVEKGVSGTKQRRYYIDYKNQKRSTPYQYTNKMPPTRVFDKWIVKRGLAPRDEKGRFITRQSLKFLIARKIYFRGIQGLSFYSKPLNRFIRDFPKEFAIAFNKDFVGQFKT
tara:strand:- start:618 stop:1133 length:516 start_codon:yes stop_codon:yes gene_type:complete